MGRIFGRILQKEKISFLYYFGEMDKEHSRENIERFKTDPSIKVLVSLDAPPLPYLLMSSLMQS